MEEQIYNGAPEDPRSEEAKAQDFRHEEVASGAPVKWVEKPKEQWRKFPPRDQDGSGTCVGQGSAKILGVENTLEEPDQPFIVFSARDIYERRANKPDDGMWAQDALNICSKFGATTEDRLPSQKMSEAQINAPFTRTEEDIKIADKYRAGGYVQMPIDIDDIADVILNKGKGVLLLTYAQWDEWTDVPTIKNPNLDRGNAPIRHGIPAVDAFLYKGEKSLLIEDSWGKFFGLEGQRILTENWVRNRIYFAGYLLNLNNKRDETKPLPPKPKYKFTRPLSFGATGPDVVQLQNMLKFEELFPQNVDSTGKYLQITAKWVKAWQVKHGIMDFANEKDVRKVRFGEKSIKLANQLYS